MGFNNTKNFLGLLQEIQYVLISKTFHIIHNQTLQPFHDQLLSTPPINIDLCNDYLRSIHDKQQISNIWDNNECFVSIKYTNPPFGTYQNSSQHIIKYTKH
jgi:hypothetical protein